MKQKHTSSALLVGLLCCWAIITYLFLVPLPTATEKSSIPLSNRKKESLTKEEEKKKNVQVVQEHGDQRPLTLVNSCDDVVVSLLNVPQGGNPYPFLTDLTVVGGRLVVPGHPLKSLKVDEGEYIYFQSCIPDESQHHHFHNIRLVVKAIKGDPDLFVSATRPHPTLVDSTWLSKRIGGETITLPSNHPDFPPGTRTLYFGVGSRRGISEFSISVDILDRKNKYQGLRLRKDDIEMQREKAHETWSPTQT